MSVALRLVERDQSPDPPAIDVVDRAWAVIDHLRKDGTWESTRDLGGDDALRETLHVVGEFDLDLLVRIAEGAVAEVQRSRGG
jgi:hypothetical protein